MSENVTLISETYPLVRAILGDFNSTARKYEDTAIAGVVRAVVRLGHAPGIGLTNDLQGFNPAITAAATLANITYQACLKFALPHSASGSWATRGLRKSWGENRLFIFELQNLVHDLENGPGFYTFQDLYGWVLSLPGLNVAAVLTEMRIHAPIASVTLGLDGLTESAGTGTGAGSEQEAAADAGKVIGPPTTGDHIANDQWTDVLGALWRCTVAGTPGTWVQFRAASVTTEPAAGDAGVPAVPLNYLIVLPAQNWAQFYWDGSEWQPVYLQP
ncbi:MAG: hypothetical protein A2Y38_07980 [Spirochaetes bacterium GWB1_59_5]|nr:MAG: hypothetical protein A2Y38_07980 [Spirochaetes bacterium GWB1_59_5]